MSRTSIRVYLPTTGPALAASQADGVALRTGEVGYAETPRLWAALAAEAGEPEPGSGTAAGPEPDELAELLLTAAADASLDLLARAEAGAVPPVRVVLVCDAPARTVAPVAAGSPWDHPAAVVATAVVPWSRAASVMADDGEAARAVVARAVALVRAGEDPEEPRLLTDELALSWFDASEAAGLFTR